jgi:hypothetical protein
VHHDDRLSTSTCILTAIDKHLQPLLDELSGHEDEGAGDQAPVDAQLLYARPNHPMCIMMMGYRQAPAAAA